MSLFAGRPTNSRRDLPAKRGEAILQEAARRRAQTAAMPRRSAVQRNLTAAETIASSATDAWNNRNTVIKDVRTSSLRFMQFLRAYFAAFAAGFAAFLALQELASGHINIFAALATHMLAIVAAPFYALMLAPAVFSLYSMTRLIPADERTRVYILGALPGALILLPSMTGGHPFKMLVFDVVILISGLIAAHTFNIAADKMRARQAADAG